MPDRADAPPEAWPVAVFAHNEERSIVACLESLRAASSRPLRAYVLLNGCRDNTEGVVRDYAKSHDWVEPVPIAVGDKANAWNVFVHDVLPGGAAFAAFLDGDVRAEPGAVDALAEGLRRAPDAIAAAALPASGRSNRELTEMVCERRMVLGNLYALRGGFLEKARELGVRLPLGYIGEDGLVTSLVKWDLDPTGPFLAERVEPCPAARFRYPSLSPLVLRDWKVYWRRRVRYSLRHFQHQLLAPDLMGEGIRVMPRAVTDLYARNADELGRLRPRGGVNAVFDSIALGRMRGLTPAAGLRS